MTSPRKQRARIHQAHQATASPADVRQDQLWDRMPAVGREFGSPDFERLMEEDHRLRRGVFDPAVRQAFGATGVSLAGVEDPDDLPPQPRLPI